MASCYIIFSIERVLDPIVTLFGPYDGWQFHQDSEDELEDEINEIREEEAINYEYFNEVDSDEEREDQNRDHCESRYDG